MFWTGTLGGEAGVHFHHKLAQAIMTSNGAQRWMMHMNAAIAQIDWNSVDERVEVSLRYRTYDGNVQCPV